MVASSREEWVSKARRAEELGYSTLLMADHFVNTMEPFAALSVAATATTTLRMGTFVCANDFRHPAMLAKQSATLDFLSDGRFELGIGVGWHKSEYDQTGIPFDPGGVRVSRLEEAVSIIKTAFSDEPVQFDGEYYKISDLMGLPKPVQKPHPPIMIAGGGRRILSIAAREADIVGLIFRSCTDGSGPDVVSSSADATAEKVEWVREAAGERFDSLEINTLVYAVTITEDRRKAAEEAVARTTRPYTVDLMLDMPHFLFGTLEGIVEQIESWRERYAISYVTVTEGAMETFAPVVKRLNGK